MAPLAQSVAKNGGSSLRASRLCSKSRVRLHGIRAIGSPARYAKKFHRVLTKDLIYGTRGQARECFAGPGHRLRKTLSVRIIRADEELVIPDEFNHVGQRPLRRVC